MVEQKVSVVKGLMFVLQDRGPVPHSGSTACCSNINTRETGDGGEGKVALFRKPVTWEGGGLTPQRASSPSRGSRRDLKGKRWKERCYVQKKVSRQLGICGHET